jgi:TonB family protein
LERFADSVKKSRQKVAISARDCDKLSRFISVIAMKKSYKFVPFSVFLVFAYLATSGSTVAGLLEDPPPVRVGGDVKPPTKTKDAKPVYPPTARQSRLQGVVILEVVIGTDGKVKDAKVIKSMRLLDNAAIDAVKQWEYKPTVIDGKPTPVIITTSVNFKLD